MQHNLWKAVRYLVYFLYIAGTIYIFHNAQETYRALNDQNRILFNQKEFYEEIITLQPSDSIKKHELYTIIKENDEQLQSDLRKSTKDPIDYLFFIIWGIFGSASIIFYFLEKQINRTKPVTGDTGESF